MAMLELLQRQLGFHNFRHIADERKVFFLSCVAEKTILRLDVNHYLEPVFTGKVVGIYVEHTDHSITIEVDGDAQEFEFAYINLIEVV